MPFATIQLHLTHGIDWMHPVTDKYCTSDLSNCIIAAGRAIVTATNPGCASNGTCMAVSPNCNTEIAVYYDGSNVNKSGFNIRWWYHIGVSFSSYPLFALSLDGAGVDTFLTHGTPASAYSLNLVSQNTYIPLSSLWFPYINRYAYGTEYIAVAEYTGGFRKVSLYHCVGQNQWIIGVIGYLFTVETSPFAVVPLNYEKEYLPYQELRNSFSYSYTGIDQPGWNTDDMIRVLKELFPDRAWAVFDDKTSILYLHNITIDFVPDWLVDKLSPVGIKVLKAPSDSSVAKAWLDELNRRNAYNQPPAESV
jgi:hypothetical protein